MATEMSTANTSASPETGGTGTGGAAPTIERMFDNVAGQEGEKPTEDKPQERRSEREPQRRAAPEPENDDPEDDEDDPDDLGADDKSKAKDEKDGDDESEDDEKGDEDEDPEIEIDDEGTKAKLSEVKSGYLRQQDYTRKATELAEEREVVHSFAKEMKAERDTLVSAAQELNALALALQPTKEMWEELRKDPKAYLEAQETWGAVEANRKKIIQAAKDALVSEQNQSKRDRDLFVNAENAKLKTIMPAIFDKEKGPKIQERIFKYGERMGYTREELSGAVDHREIMTLWKAMRYDEIKGATPSLGKPDGKKGQRAPDPVQGNRAPQRQSQPARGVVRQQAEKTERRKQAEASLRRTGSVEDAAMVLSNM